MVCFSSLFSLSMFWIRSASRRVASRMLSTSFRSRSVRAGLFWSRSALPEITASGDLNSWDTSEKKSVFNVSMLPSSSTILLKSRNIWSR